MRNQVEESGFFSFVMGGFLCGNPVRLAHDESVTNRHGTDEPTVGDLNGNVRRIVEWIGEARKAQADLIAFPELAITGYLPEDLLFKRQFVNDNLRALKEVVRACRGLVAVVGYVARSGEAQAKVSQLSSDANGRVPLYNAAALIANCKIVGNCHKGYVPRDGDECRYFRSGQQPPLLVINGMTIGVSIGEDLWRSEESTQAQVAAGAEVMINLNASPFQFGKSRSRERFLRTWARKNGVIASVVNMIGGHDELVFDGNSFLLDQSGQVIARGRAFTEELLMADVSLDVVRRRGGVSRRISGLSRKTISTVERLLVKLPTKKGEPTYLISRVAKPLKEVEDIYQALVLAVKDYVRKNGFTRVVIGVSGGVDSALTVVIAADALGAQNVLGIFMPSPYTSHQSEADARELVQNLGIELNVIPIASTFESYRQSLAPAFGERSTDLTEENLQARIRGNILMAMSNKMGHLV
ncbi:MAG: NAD(+) synthase, partial [Nitrospira sp.]|nr:NAD(+) synthase [Nitrospira sp.]